MANTPSAKKRIRNTLRKTDINKSRRSRIKTFVKKVEDAIETKDAKLIHYVRGAPPVVFNNLMQVRKRLISENSKRENLQLDR